MAVDSQIYDCPPGTQFYSCHINNFIGCCSTNPCSSNNCARDAPPERGDGPTSATESSIELPTDFPTDFPTALPTELSSLFTTDTVTDTVTPTPTKTDSGITHTIPNDSIVTVTKHTVIYSEAPKTTASSTGDVAITTASSTASYSTNTRKPTSTLAPPNAAPSQGLSSGAIAGAATGGAAILALVIIICLVSRRRKKRRESCDASETETLGGESRIHDSEKQNTSHAQPTLPNIDPFAPFGGRADRPHDPYRPPSGTFEMDGTGMAPVELPAVSVSKPPDNAETAPASNKASTGLTVADPSLVSPTSSHGEVMYWAP
ncbi:hypothetical protein QQS21_008472 [Conoideocrella luteorostrata]|uniref:Uncharacterized protein n=1 Tax=Conoideocrella luteorostrata TaxID=1105319 RepID=A0AAJ0CIY6_9HYPO|nr:hypothetical protein QQS21_008472 [Conoideocrella luteorostrata]